MRVRAAGGVLWRPGPDGAPEVAVVHRPRYDDWSLPKGKLEPGEHPLQAAVREVEEETGCRSVAGPVLGRSDYQVLAAGRRVPKTVDWWALRCTTGAFVPGAEVDALRWLPVPQARDLLTAGRDVEVLDALPPVDGPPVVLLRHAADGRREDWAGDDADRPLSPRGLRQAARLATLLPLLDVRGVVAAPPLRCRATVQPLADALGLPVEVAPLLADGAPVEATAALVRDLAPGTVACSQGEALDALLGGLALRKGTAAVLWRDGGTVRADLLDPDDGA